MSSSTGCALCLAPKERHPMFFDWMKHLLVPRDFCEICKYESSLFRALGQGCLVLLQFVFGRSLFVDLFLNLNDAAFASFILSCGDLIGIKLQFNKSDFAKMSPIQNTALRTLTVGLKPQVRLKLPPQNTCVCPLDGNPPSADSVCPGFENQPRKE